MLAKSNLKQKHWEAACWRASASRLERSLTCANRKQGLRQLEALLLSLYVCYNTLKSLASRSNIQCNFGWLHVYVYTDVHAYIYIYIHNSASLYIYIYNLMQYCLHLECVAFEVCRSFISSSGQENQLFWASPWSLKMASACTCSFEVCCHIFCSPKLQACSWGALVSSAKYACSLHRKKAATRPKNL